MIFSWIPCSVLYSITFLGSLIRYFQKLKKGYIFGNPTVASVISAAVSQSRSQQYCSLTVLQPAILHSYSLVQYFSLAARRIPVLQSCSRQYCSLTVFQPAVMQSYSSAASSNAVLKYCSQQYCSLTANRIVVLQSKVLQSYRLAANSNAVLQSCSQQYCSLSVLQPSELQSYSQQYCSLTVLRQAVLQS